MTPISPNESLAMSARDWNILIRALDSLTCQDATVATIRDTLDRLKPAAPMMVWGDPDFISGGEMKGAQGEK